MLFPTKVLKHEFPTETVLNQFYTTIFKVVGSVVEQGDNDSWSKLWVSTWKKKFSRYDVFTSLLSLFRGSVR